MQKVFNILIEISYWLAIFFSPFLAGSFIGLVIYIKNPDLLWVTILVASIAMITGIWSAERIRKKYGCSRYIEKIFETPDIPGEYPEEAKEAEEKESSTKNS